jgi:hypothetical protein
VPLPVNIWPKGTGFHRADFWGEGWAILEWTIRIYDFPQRDEWENTRLDNQ